MDFFEFSPEVEKAAEAAMQPIVATLCAFDDISAVRISLLDGSSMIYLDLDQSFSPDENWFAEE